MIVLVVDLETTAFSPKKGQIVEIGIASLNTKTGDINKLYSALVWDGKSLNEKAWIFSHSDLTPEMVKSGQPLNVEEVQRIIDAHPLTAFNNKFDFAFLLAAGVKIPYKYHCIMLLAQKVMGLSRWPSVEKAYRHFFNNNYVEKHRALSDATDEAKILFECIKEGGE